MLVGGGLVLVAVILVLVAWGCSRRANQQHEAEEAVVQEAQEEQAQEPASDLDGVVPGVYYVQLVNHSNAPLCLSATGNEDDDYTVMELGATGYGASAQRLTLTIVDADSCTLSTEGGLYLDCGDPTADAGLRLYANQANDGDGQRWQIKHATGGYRIVSKETGRVVEAPDAVQGVELVTDDEDDANTNQVFTFVDASVSDSSDSSGSS